MRQQSNAARGPPEIPGDDDDDDDDDDGDDDDEWGMRREEEWKTPGSRPKGNSTRNLFIFCTIFPRGS